LTQLGNLFISSSADSELIQHSFAKHFPCSQSMALDDLLVVQALRDLKLSIIGRGQQLSTASLAIMRMNEHARPGNAAGELYLVTHSQGACKL
jgi:hypothetical protein